MAIGELRTVVKKRLVFINKENKPFNNIKRSEQFLSKIIMSKLL